MPVSYRVEQFLRALTARRVVSEERTERLVRILHPEARALFARQAPEDQRHALAVYDALCKEGLTCEALLAAALLHDVGKVAAELPPWERGLFVLAERFAPRVLDGVTRGEDGGWRGSLSRYANHAEIGADLAEEARCSSLTVELIRRHEEPLKECRTDVDRLLAALQAADGVN